MKISNVKFETIKLVLHEPFVTAAAARIAQHNALVKVETDEGVFGIGEAVPTKHVTGETIDTLMDALGTLAKKITGMDPLDLEAIHRAMDATVADHPAAKAAFDIALFDIKGKVLEQPLYMVLGGDSDSIETDVTLSVQDPVALAEAAMRKVDEGFRILKIKVGVNPEMDIEGIAITRKAVGNGIILKADANQGYSVSDAIHVIEEIKKHGVVSIEQPVHRDDIDGMASIIERTGFFVIADESVFYPEDAQRVIDKNACRMVNIKLMKSGGIFKAERINAICEDAGVPCMVGSMVEARVANAAGAHFAAAKRNIKEVDLDGFILTKDVPSIKGGFETHGGVIALLDKPGLGVEVDF
uniref:Dipeptide epimerase n=1 Tax=uncultured bacterium contig00107 TaxID=1181573 RepID=A0A806K2E0_9BACT|nr:mandelate racemase/muconate lactonizing enzyme, N-terminal domain protein [uncultured bacterium contig00107]